MAKIKFGMMMTDARGKLGGQVFSKNRAGAYVRTKVTPVNPRTEFQQANRFLLGFFSSAWSGLTDAQRFAWNKAVSSWEKTNIFGDNVRPTGKNLFTGLNKNTRNFFPASSVMVRPPVRVEIPFASMAIASYLVGAEEFNISWNTPTENGAFVRFRATPPVSAGTSYVNNLLRDLGPAVTVNLATGNDILPAYVARFGELAIGDTAYLEMSVVTASGQISAPQLIRISVLP